MLKKLLTASACAACQGCCVFESYDIWNTPVLSNAVRQKAEALLPDAEFIHAGEASWRFRIRDAGEQFPCPLLDPKQGCLLGEDKPLMCKLYPFQIAELNGRLCITLSALCEVLMQREIGELLRFVKEELAEPVFTYAAAHPDEVLPHDGMSPILLWKPQEI